MVHTNKSDQSNNWSEKIKGFPLNAVYLTDTRLFLQFSLYVVVKGLLQTIIGWAHPRLANLCGHCLVPVFVDFTFNCVPFGFTQLIIIMIYTAGTESYVPIILFFSPKTKKFTVSRCIIVLLPQRVNSVRPLLLLVLRWVL